MRCIAIVLILVFAGQVIANDAVVVRKGERAPFTGLLVDENRFLEMVEAEEASESLQVGLRIQTALANDLELIYSKKLEEATAPVAYYETPEFNRWLGFGIGVLTTALAVWAGTKLVRVR